MTRNTDQIARELGAACAQIARLEQRRRVLVVELLRQGGSVAFAAHLSGLGQRSVQTIAVENGIARPRGRPRKPNGPALTAGRPRTSEGPLGSTERPE